MKTDTISQHKTTIFNDDGFTCVIYHDTCVIKWNDQTIVLNSDGFLTRTTKVRINQAAIQWGLKIRVWQKDGRWYVCTPSWNIVSFVDGMEISRKKEKKWKTQLKKQCD